MPDSVLDYCGEQCSYDNVIEADPNDANVVYAGGMFNYSNGTGGIYRPANTSLVVPGGNIVLAAPQTFSGATVVTAGAVTTGAATADVGAAGAGATGARVGVAAATVGAVPAIAISRGAGRVSAVH